MADEAVSSLVIDNLHTTLDLDEDQFSDTFDKIEVSRFGQTETEYKNWAVDRLRDHHTTSVTYTGDNNVTYTKTCEPNLSDISIQSITPVYLPQVRLTTAIQSYSYPFEYFAAGPSRVTHEDGVRRCVQCGTDTEGETYTFCANCGSINCADHTKTERLEGTPVCTGCAVTERFAFKTKYFYNEKNLEAFREEYAAMPFYRKPLENKPLTVGGVATSLLLIVSLLVYLGVI